MYSLLKSIYIKPTARGFVFFASEITSQRNQNLTFYISSGEVSWRTLKILEVYVNSHSLPPKALGVGEIPTPAATTECRSQESFRVWTVGPLSHSQSLGSLRKWKQVQRALWDPTQSSIVAAGGGILPTLTRVQRQPSRDHGSTKGQCQGGRDMTSQHKTLGGEQQPAQSSGSN